MMEDGAEHQKKNKKTHDANISDDDYLEENFHVSIKRSKYFIFQFEIALTMDMLKSPLHKLDEFNMFS